MAESVRARSLLAQARALYDDPRTGLAEQSGAAWQSGFTSGGEWMRRVFAFLRGEAPTGSSDSFQRLGVAKYGMASAGALFCLGVAWQFEQPWILLLIVPVFYAIEAQMVFLFPLLLDGSASPLADSRRWTLRAGGTFSVMRVVLPLAVTMLFGGLTGQGFVRSWCVGCLSVCLWYEQLRTNIQTAKEPASS
jgi:hypothetical protein